MGHGSGECGKCRPCGVCDLSNKKATFICGIICSVVVGLWLFINFLYLCYTFYLASRGSSSSVGLYLFAYILGVLVCGAYLALSILLIFATKKDKIKWVYYWILGTIIFLGVNFLLGIVVEIWYGVAIVSDAVDVASFRGRGYYYGGVWRFMNTFLWFGFAVTACWIWYPWWIAYCYYIELGGKPWSDCCANDGSGTNKDKDPHETPSERSPNNDHP